MHASTFVIINIKYSINDIKLNFVVNILLNSSKSYCYWEGLGTASLTNVLVTTNSTLMDCNRCCFAFKTKCPAALTKSAKNSFTIFLMKISTR